MDRETLKSSSETWNEDFNLILGPVGGYENWKEEVRREKWDKALNAIGNL
jgi:hypothetical protein